MAESSGQNSIAIDGEIKNQNNDSLSLNFHGNFHCCIRKIHLCVKNGKLRWENWTLDILLTLSSIKYFLVGDTFMLCIGFSFASIVPINSRKCIWWHSIIFHPTWRFPSDQFYALIRIIKSCLYPPQLSSPMVITMLLLVVVQLNLTSIPSLLV